MYYKIKSKKIQSENAVEPVETPSKSIAFWDFSPTAWENHWKKPQKYVVHR